MPIRPVIVFGVTTLVSLPQAAAVSHRAASATTAGAQTILSEDWTPLTRRLIFGNAKQKHPEITAAGGGTRDGFPHPEKWLLAHRVNSLPRGVSAIPATGQDFSGGRDYQPPEEVPRNRPSGRSAPASHRASSLPFFVQEQTSGDRLAGSLRTTELQPNSLPSGQAIQETVNSSSDIRHGELRTEGSDFSDATVASSWENFSLPNSLLADIVPSAATDPESWGFDRISASYPHPREPFFSSPDTCELPDIEAIDMRRLGTQLERAIFEHDFKKKLTPFFKEIAAMNTSADALTEKLERAAGMLHRICRANSSDARIPWDNNDPERLKQQALQFVYVNLFQQFDTNGFQHLTNAVMSPRSQVRFQQTMQTVSSLMPHCDGDYPVDLQLASATAAAFPGGPYRSMFMFDLSRWLTQQLMGLATKGMGGAGAVSGMMAMMAVMSVISVVETVAGIVIDIVPPMIPPPFWILWSLPCLPMLLGPNCLLSVLYPISLTDFMLSSTTDGIMNGIITSFPATYATKVGKTKDSDYKICAMSYLGMYCASIFPMCWIPMGVRTAMSFPMCFVHCILTLVACPGFWIDEIIGPCMSVSAPPLCSFSLYINDQRIPPQYTTYTEGHPYPAECPEVDPTIDTSEITAEVPAAGLPPVAFPPVALPGAEIGQDNTTFPKAGESLFADADAYANVAVPEFFVCDCNRPCLLDASVDQEPCNAITNDCRSACARAYPERQFVGSPRKTTSTTAPPQPRAKKVNPLAPPFSGHVIPVEI